MSEATSGTIGHCDGRTNIFDGQQALQQFHPGYDPTSRTASSPGERSSRDDRAIQYSVTAVFSLSFAAYFIPAFAG